MTALLNERLETTKSKESAPEVLSYRQRLYDRETLMLPNEPWNPAARLAQVRARRIGASGRGAHERAFLTAWQWRGGPLCRRRARSRRPSRPAF